MHQDAGGSAPLPAAAANGGGGGPHAGMQTGSGAVPLRHDEQQDANAFLPYILPMEDSRILAARARHKASPRKPLHGPCAASGG